MGLFKEFYAAKNSIPRSRFEDETVWNASDYDTENEDILAMAKWDLGAEKDNQDVSKGAAKFDGDKVRVDLVPGEFIYAVAAVLTYGAIKYDDWNWAKGLRKGRIMGALGRHWIAYMMGEQCCPESGLPHSWHIATNAAMLISSELRGVAVEDRQEAVAAYEEAQKQFTKMKDPKASRKNVGGSIIEEATANYPDTIRRG